MSEHLVMMTRFLTQLGVDLRAFGQSPVFNLDSPHDIERLARILEKFTVDDRAVPGSPAPEEK